VLRLSEDHIRAAIHGGKSAGESREAEGTAGEPSQHAVTIVTAAVPPHVVAVVPPPSRSPAPRRSMKVKRRGLKVRPPNFIPRAC
jgi:hypothetical protein